MATETVVQASSSNPPYAKIAEQIIAITSRMREDAHDQETIRVALQTFSHAVQAAVTQPVPVTLGGPRPY